jgi:general secretion pathway protein A
MPIQHLTSRFGFHQMPFTREIRVEDLMRLPDFDEALRALERTVDNRMSAAIIAPAGTGKSVLLRALAARLPEARYNVHYVKVADLGKRDMCRELACAAGAHPAGSYPKLVMSLQERYRGCLNTDGLRPVLLLDEAHDLRPDVLAMLRLLTNFDMDSRLVVSVILCGQPPLKTLLRRDNLEDIARRLAHFVTLRTLTREQTTHYLEHRCRVAGASSSPFDPSAHDALFEIARGNLRATDRLALKALEVAHDQDVALVDSNHLIHARQLLWP